MKTIEISILSAASILDYANGEITASSPFYLDAIRELRQKFDEFRAKGGR